MSRQRDQRASRARDKPNNLSIMMIIDASSYLFVGHRCYPCQFLKGVLLPWPSYIIIIGDIDFSDNNNNSNRIAGLNRDSEDHDISHIATVV